MRVFLSRYRGYSTCSDCGGARLRIEAQQVKIAGKNICRVTGMTVEEASKFFAEVKLTEQESAIADKLLEEIQRAPAVSDRCRAGIPDPGPAGLDSLRRRSAAHPAGDFTGFAAGRNALCAG